MALTGNKFTDLGEIAQVYAGVLDTFLIAPLVGPQCSKRIVTGVFTLDAGVVRDSCFSLLVSKGLGLGIVVGGSIVKVPQILKIFNSGSARGISLVSYVLETLAYVITLSYNLRRDNPFSTYGEVAFITLQNVIILLMLTFYSKKYVSLIGVTAFFAAATYALNSDLLPDSLLVSLQWAAIVISTVSKLPQIYTNFANGDTGALSAVTVALQFVGSAARIFTTLREVKDQVILVSFIMATALNGILFGQVLFLGGGKGAAKKKGSAAKNAAKKAKSASKKD